MTRKQLLPLALLLLVASGHGQDTAWPAAMVEKVLERFPGADVDGDGKLSPNEQNALSQKALKKHPQADRDGDAVLSRPEQQALLRKVMLPVPKANTPPVTPPPTSVPILPLATDLRAHGLTQEQIDSLAKKIRQIVSREFIAGCSFLVAHKGEIVFRQAFGYADIESKRPFTTDELLPIASVSKPVAASVIMALVEQEKLKLDAPVAQYLPDFQGMKPFTLRHLLAHTAGFWGNKNISPEKVNLIRNFERSLSESVADIATYDLLSEPGQKFQYSGAGYCVAGRVAEVALGQSFEQIAQEVLFRPLGLPRTTFLPPQETRRTIPTAYRREAGQLRTQLSLGNVDELRFILPGGSLFTTLDELAVFGQMHLNDGEFNGNRILSEATVAEMRRLQSPEEGERSYGLGWFRGDVSDSGFADLLYHNGALGAHLRIDRRREVVTVFLAHQTSGPFVLLKNMQYQQVNQMFPLPEATD